MPSPVDGAALVAPWHFWPGDPAGWPSQNDCDGYAMPSKSTSSIHSLTEEMADEDDIPPCGGCRFALAGDRLHEQSTVERPYHA